MSILPFVLLALAAGACLPTQAGINAQLNLWSRSPVLAAAISFAVGTVALGLYALMTRVPVPSAADLGRHPWWIWTGGFLGAFLVASTVVLAPRMGAAAMVALIIAGQMITSLILDHFGLLGYDTQPITLWRVLGIGLIVCGVFLIRLK